VVIPEIATLPKEVRNDGFGDPGIATFHHEEYNNVVIPGYPQS
jgi:hypothetical protein